MAWHNDLGREGEEAACQYLESQGLCVLDRNWHCGKLELDIVARKPDENLLHFVEVRTRLKQNETRFGYSAAESVTMTKLRRIVNAAMGYMRYYNMNMGVEFDIVAVHYNAGQFEIEWLRDVFTPQLKTYR